MLKKFANIPNYFDSVKIVNDIKYLRKEDINMYLGKNISDFRKKNGISQEQLAEQIGVSRQTISNWELGETSPNSEQLISISRILDISIDELIGNQFNLLDEKIKNTENLVKKHLKFNKVLFLTIYFLVLTILIIISITAFTKRDFTKDYQTEFTCILDGVSREVYLEEVDFKYIIWNGDEKYLAGDNISEVFASLNTLKEFYISQGAVCK